MGEQNKYHGMEMFHLRDKGHLSAMKEMQELMQQPDKMKGWFENKKRNLTLYQKTTNYQ